MIANLLVLWLAALPLMASPGPATLSTAAVGAAFGTEAGLRYLVGIIAGTFGVLLLIATGVTGLILASPSLVGVITVLAAAYIVYLAYRIATAPVISSERSTETNPSFANGFILAIANPKAFAAIGAVYSGHTMVAGNVFLDSGIKILALLAVIVLVNTGWLYFGSVFARYLRDPRAGRIVNVVFALLLVLSVVLAFKSEIFG